MRHRVLAALAGLAVAMMGAVILGEYDLVGYLPIVAGVLFGVVVAEVTVVVGRTCDTFLLAAVALVSGGGLVWATWISTGHRLDLADATSWVGVVAATIAAPAWLRTAGRRAGRSRDGAEPARDE